jgi:hypothetical protein
MSTLRGTLRNVSAGTGLMVLAGLVALGAALGPAGEAAARTWSVPGDAVTIKTAIEDSSAYGDTVLVAAAVYDTASGETFPITMADGVVLLSQSGPALTVIEANSTERVFNCVDLDSGTVIAGFTITGGFQIQGAGIYCVDSYVEIRDNIVTGNIGDGLTAYGGGIYCSGGAPIIVDNEITGNKAKKNMGGGIFCGGGTAATIENNLLHGNVAKYGGGIFMQYCGPVIRGNTVSANRSIATGAGVDCSFNSYPVVTQNVIVHNRAVSDGCGIACCYGTTPTITYNTIAGNSGTYGGGVRTLGSSSPEIRANIIVDNVDAIYVADDSDSVYAHANNMYFNSYSAGDFEVINHTTFDIDITTNYWYFTDSLLIAGLISGPAHFVPFESTPVDTVPGEPSAVSAVSVMEDASYSTPMLDPAMVGDTLFIELEGTDWNGGFIEPALVIVTSNLDPVGVAVALIETGPATGIYRGLAYVDSASDDMLDRIGAADGEITVRANVDPSAFYVVTVATAGIGGTRTADTGPAGLTLSRNHPDPFSGRTEIEFTVPVAGTVTVEIYDVSGRLVRTLVRGRRAAGSCSVSWDAADGQGNRAASGVYFCHITVGRDRLIEKLILLR